MPFECAYAHRQSFSRASRARFFLRRGDARFRFKVVRVPDSLEEDENFPYEDEIFLVNVGETGKFTSDKIFQSKFTVFKDGGDLCCNGYAPDFARKSNVIEGRFAAGQSYRVKLTLTKYRVYVEINGGQFKTSYGNGREEITDAAFYARKGVAVELDEESVTFTESENGRLADRRRRAEIDRRGARL